MSTDTTQNTVNERVPTMKRRPPALLFLIGAYFCSLGSGFLRFSNKPLVPWLWAGFILCLIGAKWAESAPPPLPRPKKTLPAPPAAPPPHPRLISAEPVTTGSPRKNTVYLRPMGIDLLANGGYSPDNGSTWEALKPNPDFDSSLPKGYRRESFPLFVDQKHGRVLWIVNSLDTLGLDPNIVEPPVALEAYYLRYRVSTDGGRTWLFDEPIIQEGNYSLEHPIEGVWKNKNGLFMGDYGSLPIRTRAGKILVPAQACILGPNGKLASPGGGFTYTDVVVLIGSWTSRDRLKWEVARVQADPARTTRGIIEPTLAELPDGRLLMVMRGSNGGSKDPDFKLPAYKWSSISSDGGYTWSKPAPWTYDDGTPFYSPSSMSQLVPHSSGRLFWVGNISGQNPRGNDPRRPLVIGEVDRKTLRLIRSSVLVIDDLKPGDTEGVELCAHTAVFEDRPSRELWIPMSRHTGGYKKSTPYLYRIGVE